MARKQRTQIPDEVAARVLFLSDRVCCVCRKHNKPIQIHHIDEDPSNSVDANLAVLCLECHRDTQVRGGFDRKLDSHQVILYRDDWHKIVDRSRHGPEDAPDGQAFSWTPGITQVRLQGKPIRLSYVQVREKDDEHRYSFSAEYPEIIPNDTNSATELNLCITSFVSRILQRFRAEAVSRSSEKQQMLKNAGQSHASMVWDDVSMSFDVILFSDHLLVLEFTLESYFALAPHPNAHAKTLNFLLQPTATPIELYDLFDPSSRYLEFLSEYCIETLHRQLPQSLKTNGQERDSWILQGAAPRYRNFEKLLVTPDSLRIIFDPYEVSSYSEGTRRVWIPGSALREHLKEPFLTLMHDGIP